MDRAALWPMAAASLLGVILLAEILAPAEVAAPVAAPRPSAAAASAQADLSGLAASWSGSILARPIFRPDRRPLEAAPVVQAAMPRLTAIVVTAAGASAIFVGDDGTAVAVKAGGTVDGMAVKSITATGVTLAGPTGVTILRPQFGAGGADPAAASAGSAGAPGPAAPAGGFVTNMNRF